MADDDDPPALSAETLAALREFMADRAAQQEREEAEEAAGASATLASSEDWQLSQFWYDESTSLALANELLRVASEIRGDRATVRVACLACPSLYKAVRSLDVPSWLHIWLFEIDTRFSVFGDAFVHYDFNAPLSFPDHLRGSVDIVALDPPFLQQDCLAAFARTTFALRRDHGLRVLLCTGAVMLRPARALLGARPTRFHVGHANRLSNPFALYVNYDDGGRLGGVDAEAEAAEAAASGSAASAAT
jgi:EEF1A lysine methyltransferase 1